MNDVELFVARQPIFDTRMNVFAYELLFRSGLTGGFDGTEENLATSKVISAVFYSPDGESILGGKPAFINFPQRLLVEDGALLLPPRSTVIEVLENVQADDAVVAACDRLRAKGYRIALDDVVDAASCHPLAHVADIVKVDFRATDSAGRSALALRYHSRLQLLAEKVETQEEFREAVAMKYSLFQGYFFAKPVITATKEIPGFKLNYLRILKEIHRPELDLRALTKLIKHESSLSYKLIKFVNSALFSARSRIESIERAVVFIGENKIRRWLSVVALMDLTSDKPSELLVSSMIRARFVELLAPEVGLSRSSGDLFLVGMFSHLDAMLGRPLEELLDGLRLPDEVGSTLLGTAPPDDRFTEVWDLALAYEAGDWVRAGEITAALGIAADVIPAIYSAAVTWSDEVTRH